MAELSQRPFDLAKLDTESIRKKRRKKLLLYSAPIVFILVLILVKLVSLSIITSYSNQAYGQSSYVASAGRLTTLGFLNVIEPHKYFYNKGTSFLKATEYDKAELYFYNALKKVPKSDECFVRVNLVLTLIAKADKSADSKDYVNAIIGYDKAKAVIDARDCGLKLTGDSASSETKEADKKLQEKRKELTEKQNEAKKAQNGDQSEGSSESTDETKSDEGEPTEAQQKALEQQQAENNQKARQKRELQRQGTQSENKDYNDRSYLDKRW